ncbi:hypothetical protein DIPPA_35849 [Diplonema papillatum]|nr:hypothetical protein DIPPA_35849 [Diplonema papillatum]|eukprot:gene9399-14576_t
MMHALSLALLVVAAWAGTPPDDVLVGILRQPYPNQQNCSLNHLNYTSGLNVTLTKLAVCTDRTDDQSNGQNTMAVIDSKPQILYTTGSGSIWGIDPYTGSSRLAVSVPNGVGVVGLAFVNGTVFALTKEGLYSAPVSPSGTTPVSKMSSFKIDEPSATAFSASQFFATTQDDIIVVSLSTGALVKRTAFGFNVIDVDYDPQGDRLVALYNYGLYFVDPSTAKATEIIKIPDGDGYPNTAFLDASTQFYYFADFDYAYSIDLSGTPAIRSKVVYDGYFCEGHFFPIPPKPKGL